MKKIIFFIGLLSMSLAASAQELLIDFEVKREYHRLIAPAMADGRDVVRAEGWGLTVEQSKKDLMVKFLLGFGLNIESITEVKQSNDNIQYGSSLSLQVNDLNLEGNLVIPYLEFEVLPLGDKGYKTIGVFHKSRFLNDVWDKYKGIYRSYVEVVNKGEYMYCDGYKLLIKMFLKKDNLDYLLWLLRMEKPISRGYEFMLSQFICSTDGGRERGFLMPGIGAVKVTHYLPKEFDDSFINYIDEYRMKHGYYYHYEDGSVEYVTPQEYKKEMVEGWGTLKYNADTVYFFVSGKNYYCEYWNGKAWVEPKVVKQRMTGSTYYREMCTALAVPANILPNKRLAYYENIGYGEEYIHVPFSDKIMIRTAYYVKGENGGRVNLFDHISNYEPIINNRVDMKTSNYYFFLLTEHFKDNIGSDFINDERKRLNLTFRSYDLPSTTSKEKSRILKETKIPPRFNDENCFGGKTLQIPPDHLRELDRYEGIMRY